MSAKPRWIVGMTGASGAIYGVRLVEQLLDRGVFVDLVVTDAGWRVLQEELGWNPARRREELRRAFGDDRGRWTLHAIRDFGAPIASGSVPTEGMVVVPCSMGTLSGIARSASDNLLERAADVVLKEGRRLILVPRETPLHAVHLELMLALSRLGARIVPAMPAFYHRPRTLDDLVDFMVGKLLDQMGFDHDLFRRWGEANGDEA
ncbi:MAG: aromatic acid decarboxylase [Candidatus Reconcilbacillus cellulovorans]|uniref:Flavin prenyltransferase UbiX n=1 Tax=Candidatus Reconcilbacillus cellulovorans TaxID=1906605 RepID=A0A2A6E307_9BACL|nr:MAG: aromatic acid decarboxylase [Candidatus Reconcilbacillus cellulovorans]